MVSLSRIDKDIVNTSPSHNDIFRYIYSCWGSMPPNVRFLLLTSSVDKRNLVDAYKELMIYHASKQHLLKVAVDFLLAAWEIDPLDVDLGSKILLCKGSESIISDHIRQIIQAVISHWDKPVVFEDVEKYNGLLADYPDLRDTVSVFPPLSLSWWNYVKNYSQIYSALEWFEILINQAPWRYPLHTVQQRILLDIASFTRKYDLAHEILSYRLPLSDATMLAYLGNLAFLVGNQDDAISLWQKSLLMRPWDTNLILRLYDVMQGLHAEKSFPVGRTYICLYSYNKADKLDKTIQSLVKSDLKGSPIVVLINGSTDGSFDMVRSWQDRIGKDKLDIITTPVNIGAPAARNWLLHYVSSRNADWIAYLDDDVIVPEDWLHRFGQAILSYPNAGVYGCKIVDANSPYMIQCADNHLKKPPGFRHSSGSTFYCSIVEHYGKTDIGNFGYIRPCIQVSGCCHIFSVKTLLECGSFDLRFSPSQHDDLDHNFRETLMKKPPVYTGHLTVKHANVTGKQQLVNRSQQGNLKGNTLKLYYKYLGKSYKELLNLEMAVLWDDLSKKIRFISGHMR